MKADLAQELLNELGTSLEDLETRHAALLQFLKDKGIVSDDEFAPYLTQAGESSSVRWRAARIRLDRLISLEKEKEERFEEEERRKSGATRAPVPNQDNQGKSEDGQAGAAPQPGEETGSNAAVAGAESTPVTDQKHEEPPKREDNKPQQQVSAA